jgi:hypothetical protein
MIILGSVLVILGFLFSFLMVVRIIEPGFALSFLSYAASFSGLFLGLIGVALYRRSSGQ